MSFFLYTNANFLKSNGDLTAERTGGDGTWQHEKIGPLVTQSTGVHSVVINIQSDLRMQCGIIRQDLGGGGSGFIGSHVASYGYDSDYGYKYNNGSASAYGALYTTGDSIEIVYDSDAGSIEFFKNGVSQGVAYSGIVGDYYFGCSCYNTGWVSTLYNPIVILSKESVQKISCVISFGNEQFIAVAPRLYRQVTQILATARRLNLAQFQIFDTTIPLYLQQEQVFNNLAKVALLTTQVMRNYGAPVAMEVLQTWAAYDYNLVYLPAVQVIGAALDGVLQEIQFSVTVAASPVGIVDCDFDRKGFCNVAHLLLRNRSEWVNKAVGDPVVLTVFGEQYQLIVVNKPQDEQIAQGSYENGYLLECASVTCQLAEGLNPDISAGRVTASFPSGTRLSVILDLLTDGICSYSLGVPDFPVGEYDFEEAERFSALREVLPEQYGWVIKTDQAGVLQLSQWSMPEIGGAGQKTLTMGRKTLTPPADTLYTQVEIKNYNQQDGTSGLRLEVVDGGDGTGTIYGYSVPWTDAFAIFDSEDSPAPSLLITGGAVEEVEVEDTEVEFVDYAAGLSKPCYSAAVIDWGNNDSLSPVTNTESGALRTTIDPGYSVAVKVSYTTRRKVWTFDNRKVDVSQVRLKYI